jgi:hypothetical protein
MIPDFPDIKSEIHNRMMAYYRKRVEDRTVPIPKYMQHEGNKSYIQKDDGSIEEVEAEQLRSTIQIPIDKVPGMSLDEIREKLNKSAEEMASQFMGMFYRVLNQSAQEVGTAIDAKGQKFNSELFLEMLSRMHWDFDKTGQWRPPSLILHPNALASIKTEITQWEQDQNFKKRFEQLMLEKREEWYERESHRKLVD